MSVMLGPSIRLDETKMMPVGESVALFQQTVGYRYWNSKRKIL